MELDLTSVDHSASLWDVKRAVGAVLHSNVFYNPDDPKSQRINFDVKLNEGITATRNNGTGKLILPSPLIGNKFLRIIRDHGTAIAVNGRKIFFARTGKPADRQLITRLAITPYVAPELEEALSDKMARLDYLIPLEKIQIGVFFRESSGPRAVSSRCLFSNEYELRPGGPGPGVRYLKIDYSRKIFRVQLQAQIGEINSSVSSSSYGYLQRFRGSPATVLLLAGDDYQDNRKFRDRIRSFDRAHDLVAPYAHHLRITLQGEEDTATFARLCTIAGLASPIHTVVEAEARKLYIPQTMRQLNMWLNSLPFPVAFQNEACIRNGLLTTKELQELRTEIERLHQEEPLHAADILRHFVEILLREHRSSSLGTLREYRRERTLLNHLRAARERKASFLDKRQNAGTFLCHHVTVTPTRFIPEGPYAIQSNRVIRKYSDYRTNFIRVDFKDEDRVQYRSTPDVSIYLPIVTPVSLTYVHVLSKVDDKSLRSLLDERVGRILKEGLDIAARHFEFLAYSNSALHSHAVWFVHPFTDKTGQYVDAQHIRTGLGDFSKVIHNPSLYAARIAQAFSATDPSVSIKQEQWEEVQDLGEKPYLFTDGCGTISPDLASLIWDALCKDRGEHHKRKTLPSAYQIRFLGIVVDPELKSIKMRLRPSMRKFEVPQGEEDAEIEIAKAFERAGEAHLNRSLIMILEDRGVQKASFMRLQNDAISDIHTASDTLEQAGQFLRGHALGMSFNLYYIMEGLRAMGMGIQDEDGIKYALADAFFDRLITVSKSTVLRDLKYKARIPIKDSYHLLGVADEGPAYEREGKPNVYMLKAGEIFGPVTISRSPTVHPGDIQRVRAIGEPPKGKLCSFRDLKNVVVLPSVGTRSLASCLGGGDLDGDEYQIIQEKSLLPSEHVEPAKYDEPEGERPTQDRFSTIDDICDFVVEYILSDVVGLLADRHLVVADQSKFGTLDSRCIELAKLCSQATDYPKRGIPVNMSDAPRRLWPSIEPDWKQVGDSNTVYYKSCRALGPLYHDVPLGEKLQPLAIPAATDLSDSISEALKPYISKHLGLGDWANRDGDVLEMGSLFRGYTNELSSTCLAHSLSESPDSRLSEEEVVIGTILAHDAQARRRSDLTYRMRLHSGMLVRSVKMKLYQGQHSDQPLDQGAARYGLSLAWRAWEFGMRNREKFGANSFALIALGSILELLELFGDFEVKRPHEKVGSDRGSNGFEMELV
ncbi:hypothetical protein EIP91_003452 [Steccherinum ochraceum]|uniref:RNA-dependent RNA polymerase n=1 Tax=Steccherinum ochraceum TaxID=92696 RepID=A0A4R0RD05_9APHY|nr:hypothetical protein EIP91_003452 [Steccherinum ochraceum]